MTLKYGTQKITTYGVISAIKTRELELNSQRRDQSNDEDLFSKGKSKSNSKEFKNQKNKSKIESTFCHRRGHLRQDCFFLKKKTKSKEAKRKTARRTKGRSISCRSSSTCVFRCLNHLRKLN